MTEDPLTAAALHGRERKRALAQLLRGRAGPTTTTVPARHGSFDGGCRPLFVPPGDPHAEHNRTLIELLRTGAARFW